MVQGYKYNRCWLELRDPLAAESLSSHTAERLPSMVSQRSMMPLGLEALLATERLSILGFGVRGFGV